VIFLELDDFKGRKKPSMFGYFISGLTGAVLGGLLLLTLGPATLFGKFQPPVQQAPVQQQTTPPQVEQIAFETLDNQDISTASNKVVPSVVGIITTKFERNLYSQARKVQGVGSGIIVDPTGYILTNNHVAGPNAGKITVSLYDGRNLEGKTVWADPVLDLAIVKIQADNLAVASLGDSKSIRVGQHAIAIGNPLGLTFQRTVTAGIISAVNRTLEVEQGVFMEDLIQTDASINPGNSGGPLININGEVVGINTVKVTTAEGIGFAVPINVVKPIISDIRKDGTYITPTIGVQTLDKGLARYFNFDLVNGVYVYDCLEDKCAYKAGIRKGDIILSVNGQEINTAIDFKEALNRVGVGNNITLKIKTPSGEQKDVQITLKGDK
jgi:serine protease Do